ncbi:MAG: cytochrome c [Deltaproteobacteria bacterium]|nr:cytochrome c [Deltaproteobacteria bacterium]
MKRMYIAVMVVAGGLWCFSASLAHEDHPKHLPDGKDPITLRAYLMENVGDNAKELNDKLKAGKFAAVKVNAQAIALHAPRIPELFPQGSTSATSKAKDEIWQKWDEFVKAAQTLRNEADQLAITTADGKADAVGAQAKKVSGACKGCHDSFRKPEKKE